MEAPKDQSSVRKKGPLVRRIAKGVLLILAMIVVVRIADYTWFHTQLPSRFANANWTGYWKTQQYGLSGRLAVILPDPIPDNQDFEAEALVYYPLYSVWKTGQFVKMDFIGHFSPDTSTSAGSAENPILAPKGKLSFKATVGAQVVDYVAMMGAFEARIIGSYVSQHPSDIGFFYIQNY